MIESQNSLLIRPFEANEVRDAIFSMHSDKSSSSDGMNPGFYQSYWDVVGGDIMMACLSYLNNNLLPEDLYTASIFPIPKKGNSKKNSDLRSIALCIALYKIVSKAIAN